MNNLSNRLSRISLMVPEVDSVADVGCDHGLLSIDLIQSKKAKKVFAMDVNEGPLSKATENIKKYGLEDKIITHLSDGLKALASGDATCVVIAGMGGDLMARILKEDEAKTKSSKFFVLSPHANVEMVRVAMNGLGFEIKDEDMVFEDGHFYPIMLFEKSEKVKSLTENQAFFGPVLIEKKPGDFSDYLAWQKGVFEKVLINLEKGADSPENNAKKAYLKDKIDFIEGIYEG